MYENTTMVGLNHQIKPTMMVLFMGMLKCIWVCWPDPVTQPLLFETVKKCMVHGLYGALNPRSPCIVDGKCSKGYPKAFQEFTTMDDHGYPLYNQPDDGRAYEW